MRTQVLAKIRRTTCAVVLAAIALGASGARAEDTEYPKPDQMPKLLKHVTPVYPIEMRIAGIVGRVTLVSVIDEKGDLVESSVAQSNNPWFERPALDAVFKWKFSPAMKDGRPVKTQVKQEITFRVDGADSRDLWSIKKGKNHASLPPELQWEVPPAPEATTMAVYPFEALVADKRGHASIRVLIDRSGRVAAVKVGEATLPEFGAALVAMVDGWRFKPARKADGSACSALIGITRVFNPNLREVPVSDSARRILRRLDDRDPGIALAAEIDAPLKALSQRPPVYPSNLRNAGAEGTATIEFFVDAQGDAQLPRVVEASAPEFGYAAAQAVATWRFTAPKKGGKATVVRVRQPLNFSLKETEPRPKKDEPDLLP